MTNGELFFPIQRSLPAIAALEARVLTKYVLSGQATCRFWSRNVNDTYLVQAGTERWMLRIAPTGWRTRGHFETEVTLLQFLQRQGLTVPQPVSQRDGTVIETLPTPEGPRHAILFTFVAGQEAQPMTPTSSHRYGEAIARLHQATDTFPPDYPAFSFDPAHMTDEPLVRLAGLFADHPADYDYLLTLAPRLKQVAQQLPQTAPSFGLCHGDVNNGNILFTAADHALLDFEYIGYGWRIFDIANFWSNMLYRTQSAEAWALCEAFLAGYQSLRPLSEAEINALPAFVLMRQLWLFGVTERNLPNITNVSWPIIEQWMFGQCMPFVRTWAETRL